ncbi:Dihydrolipoyllysine-residue succinyltransferase component of 2-oxoglutarate dehydrogenase complex [bacterium HR23]|nr:Dihydrolipoyllysine-residue succinyltransferase component of 2-oxoglutarate dehydrogenase complex [bacterium HR23]
MPVRVELPHVGETVTEGIIQKWLKQPGERVKRFEPLAEVVTDKVTMEFPSPVDGVLVRHLVPEGAAVPMGSPICEIETAEVPAPVEPSAPSPPVKAPVAVLEEPPPNMVMGPTGLRPREEAPTPAPPRERPPLSPVVQRLIAEHNITPQELERIQGTGIGGRITKQDILRYLEARTAPPPAPPTPPAPAPPAPRPAAALGADEEALPLTPVRRIIAENMARSAREIPMAWSMVEVDVTGLARWREAVKEEFERKEGAELTFLPFVVKAVVEALKENPLVNSSWGGDKIILKKRINIGIAVAAPQGLVVPVIHDADRLSIAGLAKAIHDKVQRARENRLTLEDVQGGTFTINNTGALGSVLSQAIINYPQAAILTTERVVKRPVVIDDAIAIRSIMNITVTFDHRILDGHQMSAFTQAVKRRLEAMGPGTPLY